MATTYQIADGGVIDRLDRVMLQHHPRLRDAGVRVGVLFALNPAGPAIKSGGYAVLACIKIVSPKDRVTKGIDAELLIDERAWGELREGQQVATLDHELSHIDLKNGWAAPVVDEGGNPTGDTEFKFETDDLGRPKLVSVPGDWNGGDGFAAVVARHGADAVELLNLSRCQAFAAEARRRGERERA